MTVDGNRAIIVLDADPLSETGGRAGVDDSAAHHRPAAGPATEDGDRFTLGGIKKVALFAAELTEGDRDAHTL